MSLERIVSYAQNREDVIIAAFFKDVEKGFYVDIGANDPVTDSVTKLFYDKGWRGINIEPVASCIERLKEQRPKDVNLQLGISDKPGELDFTEYESDGLSTFSYDVVIDRKKTDKNSKTARVYKVNVKTLADVLSEQKVKHIHFLKVDVEGYEYEVLDSNDWDKYRPEMICIEANQIMKDWRKILEKHNYEKVFNDGLNDYYLAKESLKRAEMFDYAKDLIIGKRVLSHGAQTELQSVMDSESRLTSLLEQTTQSYEQKVTGLEKKVADLKQGKRVVDFGSLTSLLEKIAKKVRQTLKKN